MARPLEKISDFCLFDSWKTKLAILSGHVTAAQVDFSTKVISIQREIIM